MIHIQNASVVKFGRTLVKNFNWRIPQEKNIVVRGNNGSGKTILLELISGTIIPTQGEVRYDFVNGNSWEERYQQRKQNVHYISADAALQQVNQHELFYQQRYYSLGDEFVPLVKDFLGEKAVEQLHRFQFPFSIDNLLELKLTRLSNGQAKKVMILKGLAQQIPKLLLLDYPFEALDRGSRKELREFLDFLNKQFNVQLIIVDYDDELPECITHELVLDNFQIVEERVITKSEKKSQFVKKENRPQIKVEPVVEMKELTIQYGATTIIKNLNWIINKGERWVLAGKNGSGKTTLFSFIFADHPMAYSQQVYLFGKRRGSGESIWDIKNRVSYLGPEQMSFMDKHSLIVSDFFKTQNKKLNQQKLDELIMHFEIHSLLEKQLRALSSAELQIILMVNCFLSQKELLLLDEPFRFLDPTHKQKVNQYLQTHLDTNTTLVMITHDEHDLLQWGKQILWLS